jgi:hypothetical protein
MRRPTPATALYWSTSGEVACESHAPDVGTLRWSLEGWQPVPPPSRRFPRTAYHCQHCTAIHATAWPPRSIH